MRFTVDRIDHIVLNVTDVDIAAAWYQRVLGMEREDFGPHSRTALKFGGQKINLRPPTTTFTRGRPARRTKLAPAICVSSPLRRRTRWSAICMISASTIVQGPVERAGALGPILSVYCRDPDGNLVEIASYQSE